jgi:DNA polymerase-3 subunit alpha
MSVGSKSFQKLGFHTELNVTQTFLTSDIDIDYLPEAREKIKEYISSKYGFEHVCSVGLWQSYNFKMAMQDAAKALGKDKAPVFKITKTLPDDFDDRPINEVLKALTSEHIKQENPELSELADYYSTDDGKMVVDMASRMTGLLKTQGKHAAGIIISNVNLFETIPMSKLGGLWTSQWTEGYSPQLSKFGLIKWDVLGLKTMSYIWKCINFIKEKNKDIGLPKCVICNGTGSSESEYEKFGDKCMECSGSGVSIEHIDFNVKEVLRLANDLKTESVFQFETDLAKSILKKGGVKSFNDLLIYTSLGRPGPLPLIDEYIERRDDKNEKWRKQEHPDVVELFKDTFGIVVFQETLQLYWTKICGFTVPEAEAARKAVAKKWGEQLEKVMKKAEIGAAKKIGHDEAVKWNKRIETFGRYAFNRSHAVAYSIIAYLCLYFKSKFPVEWWAAVLSICDDRNKISNYVMVSRNEGVKYSALHCDNLTKDFVVRNDEIVPGLSGIKGIGDKAMANVLLNAGTKYQSVDHFIEKNGKNKILMERLIKLGAFDHLFPNRSALWMWYLLKHSTCKQSKEAKSYFKTKLGIPEKGKLNISFEEVVKLSPKWGLRKILFFEKDFFGYHFTSPMSCYKFSGHTIEDAAETNVMEVVIQDNELRQTKTNKKYLKLLVTDGTTSATLLIWDVGIIDNIEDVSPGSGIRVEVNWDEKFNSYSLRRNSKIVLLDKDD